MEEYLLAFQIQFRTVWEFDHKTIYLNSYELYTALSSFMLFLETSMDSGIKY